jgi:subtilisin family serine protease
MYLEELTGRGVRIAVIDSGVHAAHPHVGGLAGGFGIRTDASICDDATDRLGHGTAVLAAIHEKAPDAALIAIKVFWESLSTTIDTLARALVEAAAARAGVINLSLGTAEMKHRERLASAVLCARRDGAIVVAARDDDGALWLPGCLDGVLAVRADASLDRDTYEVRTVDSRPVLVTSPFPRDIPGVPRERNLNGVSFAVANASGFVARALQASPGSDIDAVFAHLRDAACAAA